MRTALPAKNCSVVSVVRPTAEAKAAIVDDWAAESVDQASESSVLWAGRADCMLFQADVLQSTGSEVNVITSKRMLLPELCELRIGDRLTVIQRGQPERIYQVTGLFLDSSDVSSIYSLTVQEAS